MSDGGLLAGVAIDARDEAPEIAVAGGLLAAFGAHSGTGRGAGNGERITLGDAHATGGAVLGANPEPPPSLPPGVPAAALTVARGYALAVAGILSTYAFAPIVVPPRVVDELVLRTAGRGGADAAGGVPVPIGPGAVCADLGASGDSELFAGMLATLAPAQRADPEVVAAEAQAWRLPVMPYRSRDTMTAMQGEPPVREIARRSLSGTGAEPVVSGADAALPSGAAPLQGLRICDLTTMWAGPLATAILARLGAEVIKVEPSCRPDGLRRGDAALFGRLNRNKARADLDLREPAGRERFEQLVASSDVVVDSFSPRVMTNLGYPAEALWRLRRDVIIAGVRAFGPGPWRDWAGYGSGIHAASGLADCGGGTFVPAAVSYPDPLAGLVLVAAIIAQLYARSRRCVATSVEVTLWGAVTALRLGQVG